MLDGIEADGPEPERLAHRRVHVLELEGLEQAQDLDVLPLAGLAHAGLEQAAQGRELLGQRPSPASGAAWSRAPIFCSSSAR